MVVQFRSVSSSFGARKRTYSLGLPEGLCRRFPLAEIIKATNNFDPNLVIGRGGFGKVYKALMMIDGSTRAVAIKCWISKSQQGVLEFKRDAELLCQLRHHHVVCLIGFCYEKGNKILVYEYMSNRSLDVHLYAAAGHYNNPLPWKQRLEICIGVARALHYLHTGVKKPIIHGDIEPTNILLDENWAAKVSDFGLSKMEPKPTKKVDSIIGTRGYVDPEYLMGLSLTIKSDVYSFGILLFEVLCARKPYEMVGHGFIYLPQVVVESTKAGKLHDVLDPYLRGKIGHECLQRFVEIAISCVRMEGTSRPYIGEVEIELEQALELQERAESTCSLGDCTYEGLPFHFSPSFCAAFTSFTNGATQKDVDDSEAVSEYSGVWVRSFSI